MYIRHQREAPKTARSQVKPADGHYTYIYAATGSNLGQESLTVAFHGETPHAGFPGVLVDERITEVSRAILTKLLVERDYIFSRGVAACMEERANSEAYWKMQYDKVDQEIREVCDRDGAIYPAMQQLPLLVLGTRGWMFIIWE